MLTRKKKKVSRPCELRLFVSTRTGRIFYLRNAGDAWDEMPTHLPPVLSLEAAVV